MRILVLLMLATECVMCDPSVSNIISTLVQTQTLQINQLNKQLTECQLSLPSINETISAESCKLAQAGLIQSNSDVEQLLSYVFLQSYANSTNEAKIISDEFRLFFPTAKFEKVLIESRDFSSPLIGIQCLLANNMIVSSVRSQKIECHSNDLVKVGRMEIVTNEKALTKGVETYLILSDPPKYRNLLEKSEQIYGPHAKLIMG